MLKRVIIIGGGHAAAESIASLRKHKWEGEILMIGEEEILPYNRPPLSKAFLSNEIDESELILRSKESFDKLNINFLLKTLVIRIDRKNKTIITSENKEYSYTKLIIATGARVRKLQIDGLNSNSNLFYLKTKKDVDQIKAKLNQDSKVLIIGGGYIGLEVAASLTKLGNIVTIVEASDRILSRVTSTEISGFFTQYHRSKDVEILLSTMVSKVELIDGKQMAITKNGKHIAFDICIVGIGVIPNIELASEAGLACDNGIIINGFCQTADADIYAVGDCANHYDELYRTRMRLESVPNAVNQGKVAAQHICGIEKEYKDLPWFWSDQYDVKLQSAGILKDYDTIAIRGEMESKEFSVFYLRDKKLIAIDTVNDPRSFMVAKKLIPVGVEIDVDLLQKLDISIMDIMKKSLNK
jgi:3-phenylpropionate/trans-cinnamate dioxygenase ferredoxin reductase subunit